MTKQIDILAADAVDVLSHLITLPSFSREEEQTAAFLFHWLTQNGVDVQRKGNNVFAFNRHFDTAKPTLLLNSHHDTVKPNSGYTKVPFTPIIEDDKLYGLGSNDAGGCLVSLMMAFCKFYQEQDLKYNIVFAATAEEEISGAGGIQFILPQLPPIDFALVGEPTLLELAVAERGLMVLDCVAKGIAGHAARGEGENALYKAADDIAWYRNYSFEKISNFLGPVQMAVTSIETENKAHNVVPAQCRFVVDVRVNELYSMEELLTVIRASVQSDVIPRSTRLKSSLISIDHPIVQAGLSLGKRCYGSPTTSDKALMPFPALKVGPGDSARSHTADEFIYISEIKEGIEFYINLLAKVLY